MNSMASASTPRQAPTSSQAYMRLALPVATAIASASWTSAAAAANSPPNRCTPDR